MKFEIVKIPDPVLRQKAKPVQKVTPELVKLAHNMLETMQSVNGVGLAAPQIGQSIQLFVAKNNPAEKGRDKKSGYNEVVPETILFNPIITARAKTTDKSTEGCLSIPGATGVVERATEVIVSGLNEHGESITITGRDLYSRVMQHEIDHLNGVLFTDRLEHFKVVFYGTSEFAVAALRALIQHPQFEIVAVVTETDKPAGRGHAVTASPIKKLAESHQLKVLQPSSLRPKHTDPTKAAEAKAAINELTDLKPHFQIVASYGKILPEEVLDIPSLVNLNIHPSLLPKYRGPSPIQSALLAGEKQTGVAIMVMAPEMDAGPIVNMYQHDIEADDTAGSLTERLAQFGAQGLIWTLEDIVSDKAEMYEQQHPKATYTHKIEPSDGQIDWSLPAAKIHNLVRAFSPKPGAWTVLDGQTVKILQTHLQKDSPSTRRILTQGESLIIDQVQLPGKKPMSLKDLKNGYKEIYHRLQDLASSAKN